MLVGPLGQRALLRFFLCAVPGVGGLLEGIDAQGCECAHKENRHHRRPNDAFPIGHSFPRRQLNLLFCQGRSPLG